jgi:hypothetical protein
MHAILTSENVLRRILTKQKHEQFGNIHQAIFAIKPHGILVLKNAYPSGYIDGMVCDLHESIEEKIRIINGK